MERGGTSIHHVYWERASYKSPILRQLRNERNNKPRMVNQPHRDLHANEPPVPVPDHDVAHELLFIAQNELDPVQSLMRASEYLLDHRDSYNHIIGKNLLRQIGYVLISEEMLKGGMSYEN